MMRGMIAAVTMAVMGGAGLHIQAAKADPVVVELYTSQGCSSCPPADAYLAELAQRDDVIALSLHVDYWDYIGWKDTFAQPKFTGRQKAYARVAGDRSVYTPQMIVGGADRVVGTHPRDVSTLIGAHQAQPDPVKLTLTRVGGTVLIEAEAVALSGPAVVQLVQFKPEARVRIKRGENAGREIAYHNVVMDWVAIGNWTGEGPLSMEVTPKGSDHVAVIVQEQVGKGGPGRILAAARLR